MTKHVVLVTRPEPDATRTVRALTALGIETVSTPLLHAVDAETDTTLPPASRFSAIAVTSANALRFMSTRENFQDFLNLQVYTVGDQSAAEAQSLGFTNILSASGALADLVALIAKHHTSGDIFYPAPKHQSGDLTGLCAHHGITIETSVQYEMEQMPFIPDAVLQMLTSGHITCALFYSRRTSTAFINALPSDVLNAIKNTLPCITIAPNCASPLKIAGFKHVIITPAPDGQSMLDAAKQFTQNT